MSPCSEVVPGIAWDRCCDYVPFTRGNRVIPQEGVSSKIAQRSWTSRPDFHPPSLPAGMGSPWCFLCGPAVFLSHNLASGMEWHGKARSAFQGTDPGYVIPGKEPWTLGRFWESCVPHFPLWNKKDHTHSIVVWTEQCDLPQRMQGLKQVKSWEERHRRRPLGALSWEPFPPRFPCPQPSTEKPMSGRH